jgi:hypothetical protein
MLFSVVGVTSYSGTWMFRKGVALPTRVQSSRVRADHRPPSTLSVWPVIQEA